VELFEALERIDLRLADRRFLMGSRFTEADVRLFTTAVRFDLVYYSHFKCNVRRLSDFPNIWGWLKDVYQLPGVAETVDLLPHQASLLRKSDVGESDRNSARRTDG